MAGIYHNATLGLISLSSDGETWITISDKNLGATTVWNSGNTLSEANAGKYYQWGNNYGFPFTGSVTSSSNLVNAQDYGPGNYYSSSTFIKNYGRWDTTDNGNLWGAITGTNEAMQGPCASGFHVPRNTEWQSVYNVWTALGGGSSDGTNFGKALKLPFAGLRNYSDAEVRSQGSDATYWSSSRYDSGSAYALYFRSVSFIPQSSYYRAIALSIRPFKNEAVIPDYNDVWDTLYGDELPDRPPAPKLKWLKNGGNYYYFDEAPTHASSITLNESSINFSEAGQTEQLTATVSPDDAVEKKPHWSSSDLTVAFVDQTGLVTCIAPGECTITATCDGVSATCSVKGPVYIDLLIVGGGGGGGAGGYDTKGYAGGGGGGGEVLIGCFGLYKGVSYNIVIGSGGVGSSNGGNTCFGGIVANGGCSGGDKNAVGGISGSGCTGGIDPTGCAWGGGGGGGATGNGCNGPGRWLGGNGGPGLCGYGGGGGGGATYKTDYGCGVDGGGNGSGCMSCSVASRSATNYGGGGGGGPNGNTSTSTVSGGNGCQGVVIVCYKTDGSCGITCATGGTITTDGDYTVHTFTSDGTFCIIS